MTGALTGRHVIVTRQEPGELADLLAARGAQVIHLPLIAVLDAADGGAELHRALDHLDDVDWLVVTSPAGAERVAAAVGANREHLGGRLRLAAVGTATARVLAAAAGRAVDVVPTVQRATALAAALGEAAPPGQRILVAQADRAAPTLVDSLRSQGHTVTVVTAYRTVDVRPFAAEVPVADAVVFASGSSVESWVAAFGTGSPPAPPCAVGIGPSTAAAADRLGLKLAGVAADHSLAGLVAELERRLELQEWSEVDRREEQGGQT